MAGFFTQMICGGTAFICTRLAEASEDEKIIYLDANNLYGWAMSQKLPYNGFRWMSQTELLELKASPKEFFERLRKEGKMCAVMGDFTVPTAIHKKTWDYPLMPEKASIPEEDQLSPKQVELNVNNHTKHNSHQQYLLQTMWDKHHYFVYGEVLDFYLQQGIEMTHLYCGIVFNVKEWLKPYVDMNTELRNKCKKEGQAIGTIVYKLMNNAIYGKFLQNVMKQSNLKFVNTLLDAIQIKVQSLPGFVRNVYHNGNFTIADVKHEEVK